jgi:hypothetical protein
MANWNKVVIVWCPVCGEKRETEFRGKSAMRTCQSCATTAAKKANDWSVTHGESKTPLYRVWNAMRQRCDVESSQSYKDYGGRGITYCSSWMEFIPFRDWALAAGYRVGLMLDREDNNGNYEPGNCRWATTAQSGVNRRTTKRKLADVAVMKDLLRLGVRVGLVAALYREDIRRVCDLRDGRMWGWLDPLTVALESR